MVEYGLVIGLISIVAIVALTSVGGELVATFTKVTDKLESLTGGC